MKSPLSTEARGSQMFLYAHTFVCKTLCHSFHKTHKNLLGRHVSYLFCQSVMVCKLLKVKFNSKYSLFKDTYLNLMCAAELRPHLKTKPLCCLGKGNLTS